MILFAYALIAIFFLVFLSAMTWDEMTLINIMVVAGLSIMWPLTTILLVIGWKEITKGGS